MGAFIHAAETDYTPLDDFVDLPTPDGMLRICYTISIASNGGVEPTEVFQVVLEADPFFTLDNVILRPNVTLVYIQDSDGKLCCSLEFIAMVTQSMQVTHIITIAGIEYLIFYH